MLKNFSFFLSLSLSLLLVFPGLLFAESLTLTAYYPSPAGDYLDLRVSRMLKVGSTAFTCNASSVGALWYDNSIINGMKACVKTALSPTTYAWMPVGGGSSTDPCPDKTPRHACTGTTAVYLGYPGWMTTYSDGPDATWDDALVYCANLNYGGYTDWVLPGKTILTFLQENKFQLGFANNVYWSATSGDPSNAWYQDFVNGNQICDIKFMPLGVRCVRSY